MQMSSEDETEDETEAITAAAQQLAAAGNTAAAQQLTTIREVVDWMNAEGRKVVAWGAEHPGDYRGFNRRLRAVRYEAAQRFVAAGITTFVER
jgi:hypothetical protein